MDIQIMDMVEATMVVDIIDQANLIDPIDQEDQNIPLKDRTDQQQNHHDQAQDQAQDQVQDHHARCLWEDHQVCRDVASL